MTKTLKVRIPAVIAPDGRWCAYDYPAAETAPDWDSIEEVADNGTACSEYRRVWITAELPVPETAEVVADAVQ
jgi:hypothetical protein